MNKLTFLIKATTKEFIHDNAAQMAAALAYYTLFAIPSILLISLNIMRVFLADAPAREMLLLKIQSVTGQSAALLLSFIIDHLNQYAQEGQIAQWIGVIVLLVSASGAFNHLHVALNTIWNIDPHPSRRIAITLQKRFTAFFFILVIGLLILASFAVNGLLDTIGIFIYESTGVPTIFLLTINMLISFIGIACFLALIFKFIPEGDIVWKDAFAGALFTTILIQLGRYGIGIVTSNNSFSSIYGAAGSLLILLIWIYYLALIFFFGAEFTQVYARLHGSGISLGKDTVSLKKKLS